MKAPAASLMQPLTPDNLPDMLTVREVCAALRVGKSSVYDAIRRGIIPHKRVDRAIRIPREWVLSLNDKKKEGDE